jgi:hypothetical protein
VRFAAPLRTVLQERCQRPVHGPGVRVAARTPDRAPSMSRAALRRPTSRGTGRSRDLLATGTGKPDRC